MMRTTRKGMIMALAVLATASITAGTVGVYASATTPQGFEMDGASIRMVEPLGMRFHTLVPEAMKEGYTFGTLIIPQADLMANDMTADDITLANANTQGSEILNVPASKWQSATEYTTVLGGVDNGAGITNYPVSQYKAPILARAYAVDSKGATVYTEVETRTLAGVANQAIVDADNFQKEDGTRDDEKYATVFEIVSTSATALNDVTWVEGKSYTIEVTAGTPTDILVNGEVVADNNYSVEGSIVTLTEEYAATLNYGANSVIVLVEDVAYKCTATVKLENEVVNYTIAANVSKISVVNAEATYSATQQGVEIKNNAWASYPQVSYGFTLSEIEEYDYVDFNFYVPSSYYASLAFCLGGGLAAPWYYVDYANPTVRISVETIRTFMTLDSTCLDTRLLLPENEIGGEETRKAFYVSSIVGGNYPVVTLENEVVNYTREAHQLATLNATDAVLLATAEAATLPNGSQEALKMSNAQDQLYPYFKFTFPAVDISAYEKIVLNMYVPEGIVAPSVCLGGALAAPWYSTSTGYCAVEIPVTAISEKYSNSDLTAFTSFEIRLAFDGNTNIAAGALSVYFMNVVGVEAEEVEEVLENVVANYTLESYQSETLTATDAVLLATAEVATLPNGTQEAIKISNAQDQAYPYFKFTFSAVDISGYEKIVLNMYVPEGIVAPLVCLGGGLAAPWYSTSNGYCSVEIPVSEISRVYPTADLTAFTSFEIRLAFDGNTNIAAGALSVYFLNIVGA